MNELTPLALMDWLGVCCAELTDKERRILWLKARGFTDEQIANELNTTRGSVVQQLYTGKAKVKEWGERLIRAGGR